MTGKALIDGASYEWKGLLADKLFKIQFTGSRYEGYAELKRVPERKPPE